MFRCCLRATFEGNWTLRSRTGKTRKNRDVIEHPISCFSMFSGLSAVEMMHYRLKRHPKLKKEACYSIYLRAEHSNLPEQGPGTSDHPTQESMKSWTAPEDELQPSTPLCSQPGHLFISCSLSKSLRSLHDSTYFPPTHQLQCCHVNPTQCNNGML